MIEQMKALMGSTLYTAGLATLDGRLIEGVVDVSVWADLSRVRIGLEPKAMMQAMRAIGDGEGVVWSVDEFYVKCVWTDDDGCRVQMESFVSTRVPYDAVRHIDEDKRTLEERLVHAAWIRQPEPEHSDEETDRAIRQINMWARLAFFAICVVFSGICAYSLVQHDAIEVRP